MRGQLGRIELGDITAGLFPETVYLNAMVGEIEEAGPRLKRRLVTHVQGGALSFGIDENAYFKTTRMGDGWIGFWAMETGGEWLIRQYIANAGPGITLGLEI